MIIKNEELKIMNDRACDMYVPFLALSCCCCAYCAVEGGFEFFPLLFSFLLFLLFGY